MKAVRLSALLLLLAAQLPALGSSVTWLGGTLPYDTVPHLEADPKLLWGAGSGEPVWGAALDVGITDWWMLQGDWLHPVGEGRALTRLKLWPTDWHGFGGAVFGGIQSAGNRPFYGGILSLEGFGMSLAYNVTATDAQTLRHQIGFWAPYAVYALRPGLEFVREDGTWVFPQLALNFGGDLSFDVGCRFQLDEPRDWRVLTRLSYQLFPNP